MTMLATEDLLVCSRCDEEKPRHEYHRKQLEKRSGKPYCKACRRAALAAQRKNDRARERARRAEARARINALKLTLSCVDCDWSPASEGECWRLHFDHIDPSKKWTQGSDRAFRPEWTWERITAEIALCEPRCNSCHAHRTRRQRHGLDPYPIPWSRAGATPSPSTPTPASSAS